jgi:DNA invertase Pin-like site-specific DNA recombinase
MSEYVIAKYLRLSIEDEKTESLSIENQHLLLDRHIDDLDIPNAKILNFVDNGHTGVNMERPAVQELLDLVRSGGVNLIIIKDFSRFSRNAMDSGYFIEQVFPLYQVRFVSVSDSFDSNDYIGDTGGIDVAFKFLMHEYYSADLSAKVKSAKRLQMKRGENIVARTIYGYCKAESGKWEPDGVASEVVKKIYGYILNGFTPSQIRDKLFAEQIPTPQEYQELEWGKGIIPSFLWEVRAVTRILTNIQYKGTYVSGKQESKAIGSHSKDWVDKSEWIVIPNKHTPIIEPEMFDRVQEIMKAFLTSEPTPKSARHCQSDFVPTEHTPRVLPYGYGFGGEWLLDETSSKVVRRIFDLSLQGIAEADIAATLKTEQVPTPNEHKKLKNGKDITPTCAWRTKGVRDILRDVQYTGALVCGKFAVKGDGSGRHYRTHESDWLVIPGKIPSIISKGEFDAVAELMANRGRHYGAPTHLLRGNIVKCGCCGHALAYDKLTDPIYRCYHTAADPNAECHKLRVSARLLDELVLSAIRRKAQIVLDCADLSKLRRKNADEQKIADCEAAIRQNAGERQTQYERLVLGDISRDEYLKLKEEFNARQSRLELQLSAMKSEREAGKIAPRSIAVAKSATGETANGRELVEALIKSVMVHPDKRIDINWKIADFMAVSNKNNGG